METLMVQIEEQYDGAKSKGKPKKKKSAKKVVRGGSTIEVLELWTILRNKFYKYVLII